MATPIAALNLHALPNITIARDSDIISIIDDLVERVMRAHTNRQNAAKPADGLEELVA